MGTMTDAADWAYEYVTTFLSEKAGIPSEDLVPGARLEELPVDSLDIVDFAMALEEDKGISLPDDELRAMETVQDMANLVIEHSKAQPQ